MAEGWDGIDRSQVYPWRIRIENARGMIRGAGILLDSRYVLTCAHVVTQEHVDDLYVHFDGSLMIPAASATIVSRGPLPGNNDDKYDIGDVAVLKLAVPVTGVPRPVLRRTWRWDQGVRMFGFPGGVGLGEWVQASVAGPSSHPDAWVQLEVKSAARVEQGFSGAAVIDNETGDVIGMVVAVDRKDDGVTCWMIEVRMIRIYAPLVDTCVAASTSVDPAFLRPPPGPPGQPDRSGQAGNTVLTAQAHALASWLTQDGPGGVCVVTGGAASGRAGLLAGLISLVEQENGPEPAPGRIDVAVDATGKTPAEISRQLGSGLAIPADDPATLIGRLDEIGPPVGVVVDAVDAAARPEALGRDLIEPLAAEAERQGIRLLLGFGTSPPRALRGTVITELPAVPPVGELTGAPAGELGEGEIERRLAALSDLAGEVDRAEGLARRRHEHVAHRIRGVPPPRPASRTALRLRIAVIGALAESPEPAVRACVPALLDACRHTASEALRGAEGVIAELDELPRRRDELRGLLDSYAAHATDHGLEEDGGLGVRYARARDQLWRAPCDLTAAKRDVASYIREVRRRLGAGEAERVDRL
jgi:hypothetical protein